jgi:hypothetical protein
MKKILIIADGIVAKHFLERVINTHSSQSKYFVVYYDSKTIPEKRPENFKFYNFDPTSFIKLSNVLNDDLYQVMIIMSNKIDTNAVYKNIRMTRKDLQVILLDRWDLEIEDRNLFVLNASEILASRFSDYLPDIPVFAQNVGLGSGEIMEIAVPVGSSYVYRHLASIEQKNWRVSAIYRGSEIILPRPTLMVQPNDILLVIGDPNILKSVYKSIKRELGQFPSPYGNNIYCFIDMLNMSNKEIESALNNSLLLHSKLNGKKLIIRIINPTSSPIYEKIKSHDKNMINIEVDFYTDNFEDIIKNDCKNMDIGLIVVEKELFENKRFKKTLYDIKIPVLKTGNRSLADLSGAVILTSRAEKIEKSSSVIFDLSQQLFLDIELFDFDPQGSGKNRNLIEHFENLSKIFGKKVKIIKPKVNPIRKIQNRKRILQFIPFDKGILDNKLLSIFSTDFEKLYYKLDDKFQLFIPIEE